VSGTLGETHSLGGRSRRRTIPISAPDESQHSIVLEKDRARQGVSGHHVRYVLAFGIAMGIVALAATYLLYFG
jgi:hypothetical protein